MLKIAASDEMFNWRSGGWELITAFAFAFGLWKKSVGLCRLPPSTKRPCSATSCWLWKTTIIGWPGISRCCACAWCGVCSPCGTCWSRWCCVDLLSLSKAVYFPCRVSVCQSSFWRSWYGVDEYAATVVLSASAGLGTQLTVQKRSAVFFFVFVLFLLVLVLVLSLSTKWHP